MDGEDVTVLLPSRSGPSKFRGAVVKPYIVKNKNNGEGDNRQEWPGTSAPPETGTPSVMMVSSTNHGNEVPVV